MNKGKDNAETAHTPLLLKHIMPGAAERRPEVKSGRWSHGSNVLPCKFNFTIPVMGIHGIFRPDITSLFTENLLYVRCCNDSTCALERYLVTRQRSWIKKTGRAEARRAAGLLYESGQEKKAALCGSRGHKNRKIWNN